MSRIVILGAGAFGTALALVLHRAGREVSLWGRDTADMVRDRRYPKLPDVDLPPDLEITAEPQCGADDIALLAIPMQALGAYLSTLTLRPKAAIACCKGVDLETLRGPVALIKTHLDAPAGILTGPSFATDIANGLPTALTLAIEHPLGASLQETLSTETLRLYLTDDTIGAELGGALKNVIAIACGICMGAGLGESARAALMTRGFAEIQRLAQALGARPETLAGLSGFGDLTLTCSSAKSRNFSFGQALGAGDTPPDATTEGRATARAVVRLAAARHIDMPIAKAVAAMVEGHMTPAQALEQLLARPLKEE